MIRLVRCAIPVAALVGAAVLAVPTSAQAAGKCTSSVTNGGHTASVTCSGYQTTALFRVVATSCLSTCSTVTGPWKSMASGTSSVSSPGYLTNVHYVQGPGA
jgi:hypothetical protein